MAMIIIKKIVSMSR